ncbi:Glycosyltransferase sugar-binding region containing DXD motif-containing protein [Halomonas caseinilytica]|nr:Glycosyltransferase sugar-binding region containing DXD motif-containing protein [Halomonas caseinilytica]
MRQKVMAARSTSDSPASAGIDESLGRAREGKTPSATDLAEVLQALKLVATSELNTSSKLKSSCQEAVSLLSENLSHLNEQETLDLFNQADRFGHAKAVHRSLRQLFAKGPRTPSVANALFDKAMSSVAPHQADAVVTRLLRYVPQAQRTMPEAEFALRLHGPQSALACLRQERRARRSLPEARKLIKFVQLADANGLGMRYVEFCRRRWPDDIELRLQQARLLMNTGFSREALEVLDTSIPATKRLPAAQIRAHCWLELGNGDAALAELDRLPSLTDKLFELRLQILVMQGRADDAQALIQEAQHRGVVNHMTSGHFSISLVGHHLNDLMLFRNEQKMLPPGRHEADLMARYHYPAMEEIYRHTQEALPEQGKPRCIPLQVVQYWDQRNPPESVMEVMRSWSSLSQAQYERFDSQKARSFLRRAFGPEYSRAYGLANNRAEAADFFRLCYLRHHGGLYADADDRLHGPLEALIPPGVGLVCYRESFGALANNVIAAAPGHPAIVQASQMAAEALLARDNDSTWSKTGPGLLTRAVAHYLATATPESAFERVAILPLYRLRRQVQIHMALPHKKTNQYWNSARTTSVDMTPYIMEQATNGERAS